MGRALAARVAHVAGSGAGFGWALVGVVRPNRLRRNGWCPHLGKRAPEATFQMYRQRSGSRRLDRGLVLNLPNLITVARILMVPVVVWAIAQRQMQIAFLLFLAAGVSDAVDGFLAKRFGMASELGAHLDPLADKALVVSIYVALGITEAVPRWVVILVVSRDILIVGGVMFAWFLGKPMKVKPLLVSKLNTAAQIVFATLVLAALAFGFAGPAEQLAQTALMWLVAALTLLSVGIYTRDWWRHMNAGEPGA